jgi:hypothetical protein
MTPYGQSRLVPFELDTTAIAEFLRLMLSSLGWLSNDASRTRKSSLWDAAVAGEVAACWEGCVPSLTIRVSGNCCAGIAGQRA